MTSKHPKRYDIWLVNLDPTLGSEINKIRPVVIVSDELMNKYLDTVVACPLTTSIHTQWRSRIQIQCSGKLAEIAVDQIRILSKSRLIKKIDHLSNDNAQQLRITITQMYGE
jgi:mRNA interferase MazF